MAKLNWRNHRDAVHSRELATYHQEMERRRESILPDFGVLQRMGAGPTAAT